MKDNYLPLPGSVLFESLKDKNCIIMATNVRVVPGVMKGIFRAARDSNSALIVEIARSEANLEKGYTGMTPHQYAEAARKTAREVGHDIWALHADHITVKKGTPEDIEATKKLIAAQVEAGFTSFAIDASYLYDFKGKDLKEELQLNINATTELALFLKKKMGSKPFGLEVEVGEIGKEDEHGRVLTKPEEAVVFISELNKNGVYPHLLAIANGTAHGNVYDAQGNLIEDITIDIPQTKAVAKALKDNGFDVRIAQHGITGTPRDKIASMFPKGVILKGNVATFWQNLVFDTLKLYEPELYKEIWDWVIENFKKPGKKDVEIFGKNAKFATGHFIKEISNMSEEAEKAIEARAYAEALLFFQAFGTYGTGSVVREYLKVKEER